MFIGTAVVHILYCDAGVFGAGGVWFSGSCPLPETVWRLQWPLDITAAVVSESNPTGTLTNSDLEMAAIVLHLNTLECLAPTLRHKQVFVHSDNTPSVAWLTKMATKSAKSDAVHRLVRGLALRQRLADFGRDRAGLRRDHPEPVGRRARGGARPHERG